MKSILSLWRRGIIRRFHLFLAVAVVAMSGALMAQIGGGYDLSWSSVVGGGGSSSGSSRTIIGAAGQHSAGTLTGGGYTLEGGLYFSEEPTGPQSAVDAWQDYE